MALLSSPQNESDRMYHAFRTGIKGLSHRKEDIAHKQLSLPHQNAYVLKVIYEVSTAIHLGPLGYNVLLPVRLLEVVAPTNAVV